MTEYTLKSRCCGTEFPDKHWELECPQKDGGALIYTKYKKKHLDVRQDRTDLFRFADWLPVSKELKGSGAPITFKSEKLAKHLGLSSLYITFNGYWPERGAKMMTCSFKECEAYPVCARIKPGDDKIMVVASAGNTARAFARVCSANNIPLLLCVPFDYVSSIWSEEPLNPCVKLICTETGSDYFDAINLSNIVCKSSRFFPEGGAKNVARRDGMGTTVLSAVTTIGSIPEFYFQAVGSGTGAIAAWEANQRLIEDGRYGNGTMKLMLSQNSPFVPMYDAWNADSRELLPMDQNKARHDAESIFAHVLSNRKPPYSMKGGLYDVMKDAGGCFYSVTNDEAKSAQKLFLELEGNDIAPAASVAVASLIQAVNKGDVAKDSVIMLNITGGGSERLHGEKSMVTKNADLVFPVDADPESVIKAVENLF